MESNCVKLILLVPFVRRNFDIELFYAKIPLRVVDQVTFLIVLNRMLLCD